MLEAKAYQKKFESLMNDLTQGGKSLDSLDAVDGKKITSENAPIVIQTLQKQNQDIKKELGNTQK